MSTRRALPLAFLAASVLLAPGAVAAPPLPVALTATGHDGEVLVDWTMPGIEGVLGFGVFRSRFPDLDFVEIDGALLVAGGGNRYAFLDRTAGNGLRFYYRIEVVGVRGDRSLSDAVATIPDAAAGPAAPAPGLYAAIGRLEADAGTVVRPDPLTPPAGTGGGDPTHAERLLGIDLATAGIRLLDWSPTGATLEVLPPVPVEVPRGEGRTRLSMAGYSASLDPGGPEVPQRRLLLAMPAAGRVEIRILEAESTLRTDLVLPPPSPSFEPPPSPPSIGGPPAGDPPPDASPEGGRSFSDIRRELQSTILRRRRELARERALARRCMVFEATHPGEPCPYHGDPEAAGGASGAPSPSPPAFFPGALLSYHGQVVSGSDRHGIFTIHPVQARPGEVHVYRRIVARVDFLDVAADPPPGPRTPEAFDTPDQVAIAADPGALEIAVQADGLYRLTHAELAAAGLDVSADPRTIRMFHLGREIAIRVAGETDGVFDPTDAVWFFGERNPFRTADNDRLTRYTDRNVYWLTIGRGYGRRMETRAVAPSGGPLREHGPADVHVESNELYFSQLFENLTGSDLDHWFQLARLFNPSGGAHAWSRQTVTVPVSGLDPAPHTARLDVALAGGVAFVNDPDFDHHVEIRVNGTLVHEAWWFDRESHAVSIAVPSNLLVDGPNAVEFHVPADIASAPYDSVFINYARLGFRRRHVAAGDAADLVLAETGPHRATGFSAPDVAAIDLADPTAPVWLTDLAIEPDGPAFASRFEATRTGRCLLAGPGGVRSALSVAASTPSSLHASAVDVDYLIVSPTPFVAEAERLANLRRGLGLSVVVADLDDVYDEFTAGIPDPLAIRSFVRYAWEASLSTRPRYLLLVGSGHFDPHDFAATGEVDHVPVKMVETIFNYSASDSWYAAVAGGDLMPDLAYGRLPVSTPAQLTAAVDKILAYETTSPAGAWQSRMTFISDNADAAGDFRQMNEDLAAVLPASFAKEKIYLSDLGLATTRTRIAAAFNAGSLFVNYHGHGFLDRFAIENLFWVPQTPGLANADQWFLLHALNCLNGAFQQPGVECLGEALVESPGGAIAFWGSSALTIAAPQVVISAAFARIVFDEGEDVVGDAHRRALLESYGGHPWDIEYDNDILRAAVYFGDPALRLRKP